MPPNYYRHPKIFTGVDETSFASAFAVEEGRFTWVGAASEIPSGTAVHDLPGPLVLPGFIDAHTHPSYIALTVDAVACTVPLVHSIPEMLAALRQHPNAGKGPEVWIEGWGYDESKLAEHRTPTRADLDQVSTTQPIYVERSDFHSAVCNTRALELAGITAKTPDPHDGKFGRDAGGAPNGILTEGAKNIMARAKGPADFETDVAKLVRTSAYLAERGIVAVTEMTCTPREYQQLDLYREAQRRGFKQHARLYYNFDALQARPIPPIPLADRSGQVAIGGIKLFMDGSMSNRTAWMRDPYPDPRAGTGMHTSSREQLAAALEFARANALQIAIHAMGDRAIEEVLDFYADEEPWMGAPGRETPAPSVRIEHGSVWTPELLRRARDARMTFGVATNIDFFFCEYDSYSENLSADQFARTYPIRDLYGALEALALSSDTPATTWHDPSNVFLSLQAAVTRKAYNGADIVPAQAITLPQAVLLYTGRARLLGDTRDLGCIAPGFQASFLTVSEDIFALDPNTLIDTQVTGTWIRGGQVFAR